MDGVAAVTGIPSGGAFTRPNPMAQVSAQPTPADQSAPAAQSTLASEPNALPGSAAAGSPTIASASALSTQQSSEMVMVSQGVQGAITSNELLGAVLLLLLLEYMKSEDGDEKKGLLAMMATLAQMQQQSGAQQSMFMHSASSLSVENSQMQVVTGDAASNAYTDAGVDPAHATDPGSGGLDVVA